MISYVSGFLSTPSWWMPDSWANALRAHDRLVGLDDEAGEVADQAAGGRDLLGLDAASPGSGTAPGASGGPSRPPRGEALPARSPRPLIVTSTWRAPAWTAASVLAVARPRSLWQWTLTTAASPTDALTTCADERAELGRDRVADRVRDVDAWSRRRRPRPRRPRSRNSGSVREASSARELDLRVAARAPGGRSAPSGPPRRAPRSRSMRSLCLRWMSLVAMNTCRCGRSATPIASTARCGSPSVQRARAATATPRVSSAIRLTASKSPGEAAGKPASMTSTLRRTSWRATSSFSAAVRPAPGACSPSRRVVSKIRIEPGSRTRRRAGFDGAHRRHSAAGGAAGRRPGPGRPSTSTGLRNAICARSVGADLLDLVVAVLLRAAARSRAGRPRSRRSSGRRSVPSWISRQDLPHRRPDAVVDDARAGDVVAVLGRVADAEAHEVEAAAVHQVDDQLELVHRLEVGQLGLVAGLDERLEGRLDERRRRRRRGRACSPNRSVSVSSLKVVSRTPARVAPMPRA